MIDTTTVVSLRPLTTNSDDLGHGESAGHDHSALDPHIWLDPTSVSRIADAVEARLVIIDPDHAD